MIVRILFYLEHGIDVKSSQGHKNPLKITNSLKCNNFKIRYQPLCFGVLYPASDIKINVVQVVIINGIHETLIKCPFFISFPFLQKNIAHSSSYFTADEQKSLTLCH